MDTGIIPAQLADLRGLTLEQIAALPMLPVLGHILPQQESVPVAAFNSAPPPARAGAQPAVTPRPVVLVHGPGVALAKLLP